MTRAPLAKRIAAGLLALLWQECLRTTVPAAPAQDVSALNMYANDPNCDVALECGDTGPGSGPSRTACVITSLSHRSKTAFALITYGQCLRR
jgi:hypothetical protein